MPLASANLPASEKAAPASSLSQQVVHNLQPTAETILLLLAVLIGGSTGMGVVTFHYLIEVIHSLMLEDFMGWLAALFNQTAGNGWTLALVPTIGGLVVGLMRWRWQDFGPGISSLVEATRSGQALSTLRPVQRMVAASVSLGTGASLGPEGPSVEIGANFGVLLGQVLQVSQERQRLLLGAGAAAGLAAGFNAPIAGVFFALEVVLGTTFATSAVSVVLLSAVVAALVAQIGLGAQPAFALPLYDVRSPLELPLYLGLGVFASLVSIVYMQTIKLAQQSFRGEVKGLAWLHRIPRPLHPILGGACVGLVALKFPQVLGVGYETIEAMLRDVKFSLALLLALLVVKLLMTALSLGSGLVGGIFAPAMYLGACLGSAYGKTIAALLPASLLSIAAPPAYAMVGMAAVLAGSVRAPLTAILLLFELTRDYRIVLPLMAAVVISVWLVERLKPAVKENLNLKQMGVNVEPDQNQELRHQITVGEAMRPDPLQVAATLSVLEVGQLMLSQSSRSALVIDAAGQLLGIVTLQDMNRFLTRAQTAPPIASDSLSIGELCTTELVYAYTDEWVAEAIDRMTTRGLQQLPVLDRHTPPVVCGIFEPESVALVCSLEVTRRLLNSYLPNSKGMTIAAPVTSAT